MNSLVLVANKTRMSQPSKRKSRHQRDELISASTYRQKTVVYTVLSDFILCGLEFERTVNTILHKILHFPSKDYHTHFSLPHAVSAENSKAEFLPVIANVVHQLK